MTSSMRNSGPCCWPTRPGCFRAIVARPRTGDLECDAAGGQIGEAAQYGNPPGCHGEVRIAARGFVVPIYLRSSPGGGQRPRETPVVAARHAHSGAVDAMVLHDRPAQPGHQPGHPGSRVGAVGENQRYVAHVSRGRDIRHVCGRRSLQSRAASCMAKSPTGASARRPSTAADTSEAIVIVAKIGAPFRLYQ